MSTRPILKSSVTSVPPSRPRSTGETLVQKVTDIATELTHAQFGAFFYNVTDPESGNAYMLYTLSGAPRDAFAEFPHPRPTAIFAPTFYGEGPVRSDDVTQDPRYGQSAPFYGMPPGHLPVRSYLAVPVRRVGGDVLGALFFGHSEAGVFTAQHERLALGVPHGPPSRSKTLASTRMHKRRTA